MTDRASEHDDDDDEPVAVAAAVAAAAAPAPARALAHPFASSLRHRHPRPPNLAPDQQQHRTPPSSRAWSLPAFVYSAASLMLLTSVRLMFQRSRHANARPDREQIQSGPDAASTDPGLLRKHSTFRSYVVTTPSGSFTYPSIRVFYRPHPQTDKLPSDPAPLPLLVFVHGLGGSSAQFHPLLTSLVNVASCLAIDLPGCGLSRFEPKDWNAYTTDSLVRLLATVIGDHHDAANGQGIIFIGHSMGCSMAALLTSTTSPYADLLSDHVLGMLAICPKAEPPTASEVRTFRRILRLPGFGFFFNLWRRWDQRGGTESGSVKRFTGPDAEPETKKLQVRFNNQSKTAVWRRMACGLLPDYATGAPQGGIPGQEVWAGIKVPLFLFAGEADHVTPPGEVQKIAAFLGKEKPRDGIPPDKNATTSETTNLVPDSAAPVDTSIVEDVVEAKDRRSESPTSSPVTTTATSDATWSNLQPTRTNQTIKTTARSPAFKTTVLPHPAAHALLYAPNTARTIAGLIQSFLAAHIDQRLSLGWQLQFLTTEGKWDVKNLAKWQSVAPVSAPIGGVFRAMKTLREVDEVHCPRAFVTQWRGRIKAVVDISHESPVYDPRGLEDGGIEYRKFPTVSKLPPSLDEVQSFIDLIDSLRPNMSSAASVNTPDKSSSSTSEQHHHQQPIPAQRDGSVATAATAAAAAAADAEEMPVLGVHCHYGFNRTGFFIVCYLVERLGYRLQDAIDEFAKQRPPGIRHDHFIDTLFVRYCVGLKRAPTL